MENLKFEGKHFFRQLATTMSESALVAFLEFSNGSPPTVMAPWLAQMLFHCQDRHLGEFFDTVIY